MAKYEQIKIGDKIYRKKKLPHMRTNSGLCPVCKIPVYVSEGQLLKYYRGKPTHKYCRKMIL